MMRSCARRSFDAATIFIALVICCVFLTARIRRRRSIRDGMMGLALRRRRLARGEVLRELRDRGVQRRLEVVVELLLLLDVLEDARMARFDVAVELGLERARV